MTLALLETALRPQFTWAPGDDIWKNPRDFNMEDAPQMGLTVFIGLATLHGFTPEEICSYLKILPSKFGRLLAKFQRHVRASIMSDFSSLLEKELAYSCRLMVKTKLVQSSLVISHQVPAIKYHDIFKY